jgi:hypothetical protein
MERARIYQGPTVLAGALVEALREKGIAAITHGEEPMLGLLGDGASPLFQSVFISDHDWQERRTEVEECLLLAGGEE